MVLRAFLRRATDQNANSCSHRFSRYRRGSYDLAVQHGDSGPRGSHGLANQSARSLRTPPEPAPEGFLFRPPLHHRSQGFEGETKSKAMLNTMTTLFDSSQAAR